MSLKNHKTTFNTFISSITIQILSLFLIHVGKVHVFANIPNHLATADLFSPFSRPNNASVFPFMLRLLTFMANHS